MDIPPDRIQSPIEPNCELECVAAAPDLVAVGPGQGLNLHLLQGKWSYARSDGNPHQEQKLLEIFQEELVLTVSDEQGNVQFRGNGHLTLSNSTRVLCDLQTSQDTAADTLVSI